MGLFDTEKQRKQPTEYVRLDQCRGDHGRCDRPVRAKQLCPSHYERERLGKPIDTPLKEQAARGTWTSKVCSVSGCERKVESYGLCKSHNENRRLGHKKLKPIRETRDWTAYYSIPKKYRGDGRESAVTYRIDFLDKQGATVASIIGCQAGGQLDQRMSGRLREPTSLERPYIERVLNGELKPLRVRVLHEFDWFDEETEELSAWLALRHEDRLIKELKADPSVECLNDKETDHAGIAKIINRRKKRLQESNDPEGVEH